MEEHKIVGNKELNIWEALIPIIALVSMLAFNVFVFRDDAISGSNQFILLMGGAVAALVGYFNKVSLDTMLDNVGSNLKSVAGAILILLLVGSLSAAWLISGVIPAMIFYGIKLINPAIFLPAAVIISSIISMATGSSWTTSATIGIALVAIGKAIGLPAGMVAGAVISGAYFGDKMSPLSDTTNLASAMAGTKLFTHIKYMTYTTVPTFIITLVVFAVLSLTHEVGEVQGTDELLAAISAKFNITLWLFSVPLLVIMLIVKKVNPVVALLAGTLLGCMACVLTQPTILSDFASTHKIAPTYAFLMQSITQGVAIETSNASLNDLFSAGGMLFASSVASCLAINLTASDQYLAIVVPGKMFEKAYKDKGLAPENLSRTLEDSGTVTSPLIPWNTCGAYQSGVLGVGVSEYIGYAVFNYLSPFMTLLFAAFQIKITQLSKKD